jgi:gluconate 5-dehydrogenase
VTVNILLPGGAMAIGMVPDTVLDEARKSLLHPDVMRAPVVFLASAEVEGLTGERIVAEDFELWLAGFRARRDQPPG